MDRKWLRHLVDPVTRAPLTLHAGALGDHILEGELLSPVGRVYPITKGIPRFVAEDLYLEAAPKGTSHDTVRFYKQFWEVESNRVLGQSAVERAAYEPRLHALLGVDSAEALRALFQDGMSCLNAGCGVAWNEYLFNVNPRANRFCVDMSLSVEQAYEHTRGIENVVVAQADLFELPFASASFDIIFSSGVLHHTRDACGAFAALARHLKPGGLIGIYVYKVKPVLRELADREIKHLTTKLLPEELREFCEQVALLGRSLQRFSEPLMVDRDVPLLGIFRGEYNLQKFLYDHFIKCFYNDHLGLDYSTWANIDWYGPETATHHTREEVTSWFVENGIPAPHFADLPGWEHSGFFVSGRKTG